MVGLGRFNVQSGGDDADIMVAVERGAKSGIQSQFGNDGSDLMISYGKKTKEEDEEEEQSTWEKLVEAMTGETEEETSEEENSDDVTPDETEEDTSSDDKSSDDPQSTKDKLMEKLGSLNLQFAGEGDDVFISSGDLGFQMGEEGNDIFLTGGSYNLALGGEGSDLMLAKDKAANFALGQDGSDWMIDTSVFGELFKSAVLPGLIEKVLPGAFDSKAFTSIKAITSATETVSDKLASVNPLQALTDKVEEIADEVTDATAEIRSALDFETAQLFGGAGDDFLAAGSTGADMIGGNGSDNYLFTFGSHEDAAIDEAGLDAVQSVADLLGFASDVSENITGGAGGDDTLELRDAGDTDGSDLKFYVDGDSDLMILHGENELRIKNMDEVSTQIETLVVMGDEGGQSFNLAEAFEAGAFTANSEFGATSVDLSAFMEGSVEESEFDFAFAESFDGWVDTMADVAVNLVGAAENVVDAVQNTIEIADIDVSIPQDVFDFA